MAILEGWQHPFGVILGSLGGSGAPPGSWALSDPLRGGSGAPLGPPGVPLGAQDGTQVGLKLALKSVQEAPKMDPKARPLSEGRWNAKMEPKWEQGTPK